MSHTTLVIPCFNEALRLPTDEFRRFAASGAPVRLLFVNDGSTDRTRELLESLAREHPEAISVLDLPRNAGKAEAVRRGVEAALVQEPAFVGFWDADLATPLAALPVFEGVLRTRPGVHMVIGARVQLLGRRIERRASRHYAGRVFATAASLALGLPVYDTQCGAKLFRAGPLVRQLFDRPFLSRWIFDVELIFRLLRAYPGEAERAAAAICELPLDVWIDVRGSKVRPRDFGRAAFDLARIYHRYRGSRRSRKPTRAPGSAGLPGAPGSALTATTAAARGSQR